MGHGMQLIQNGGAVPDTHRGGVAAIGNFDGMHRGHQQLLATARTLARRSGCGFGVMTFEPHPRTFFKPSEPVFRLTPLPLKARLASALGAQFLEAITFDSAFSSLSPEEFVSRHLAGRFGVRHVVTGYDFHFGQGRRGNPQTMRTLGKQHGFDVTIVDQVTDEGDLHSPFSSSSIRSALRHGHLDDANRELGYRWTVLGEVVQGDRRGRQIGFPTLNIVLDRGAEPFRGIYAVLVRDASFGRATVWKGAGYFGDRPTFGTDRTFLEVFLLDFSGDLYGRTLLVEFVSLIRPDRKFDSIGELAAQMTADCSEAERILAMAHSNSSLAEFELGRLQRDGAI